MYQAFYSIDGVLAGQHPGIAEQFIKIFNDFDRIIEIGTLHGGLSLFIHKNKKPTCEFISYDIDPELNIVPPRFRSQIDFRIGDCFSQETGTEIMNLIQNTSKRVLLLCDGGDKPREVRTFGGYLKPKDVLMCHDYADNSEDFYKHAQLVGWTGWETSYSMLLGALMQFNLVKYKYYHEFKSVFWGSFIKPFGNFDTLEE
jgi:hypothetical protein